jgi:hypothetical protein
LLPGEALEVLGLGPDATAAEIKETYRDLVKVWHPDRFGNDLRLRRKAEEKLQQINLAYRVLRSHSWPLRAYSWGSKPAEKFRRRNIRPRAVRRIGRARHVFVWSLACSAFAVVMVAAAIAFHHRSQTTTQPLVIPVAQRPEPMSGGSNADTSPQAEAPVSPNKTNHRSESPRFRVRHLSDAEVARLESACRGEREMQDQASYQDCVRDQLGTAGPDMSTLSAQDRSGIQSACKNTRISEGLAGYNRCLTRMVKLLRESSRP